jgi:trk system potassium uptake protein
VENSEKSPPTDSGKRRKRDPRWLRSLEFALIFLLIFLDLEIFHFPFMRMIQDLIVLFLILDLIRIFSRTLRALIHRPSEEEKLRFQSPVRKAITPRWRGIHLLLTGSSIFFLTSWLSRWAIMPDFTMYPELTLQYQTFLHAGALLAAAAFAMSSRRFIFWWKFLELTPGRMIFLVYGLLFSIGAALLILPFSLQPGVSISLIDAFFVSVASLTLVGLSPLSLTETFTMAGQSIILLMIQLGGIGIIAVTVGLAFLVRSRISLSHSLMGQTLYDIPDIGDLKTFLKRVLVFTFIAEIIGIIFIYFSLPTELSHKLFHATFHAISAFCNGGVSSFEDGLAIPGLVAMKTVVCALVLIGSIGFPVLFELIDRWRKDPEYRPISANTMLVLWMTGALLIGGTLLIFLTTNAKDPSGALIPWSTRLGEAMFYSIISRTAGFTLGPLDTLTYGTQVVITFLMVIGGSPASTAGGIKTTTAGIAIASTTSLIKGLKWAQFRNREIPNFVIQKAVSVTVLFSIVLFIAVTLLLIVEPHDPWDLIFEATAALSTAGFSLGITEELSSFSKLVIMGLMITGRLGLVTIIYVGIGQRPSQHYRFAQERFYIG